MPLLEIAQRLFVALLCGALVGLEREFVRQREKGASFAGVRTMMLIALVGALSAHLGESMGWWIAIAAFAGVAALVVVSYVAEIERDPGMTTEVAALAVFLIGAVIARGFVSLGVSTAIVATMVLSLKTPLHEFARRIRQEDLHATLKFAIVTFVILPLLPDRSYGPYGTLNPHETWLMVVLISGISFLGYVLSELLGARRGTVWAALLGGLASSTAVALAAAQRSREGGGLSRILAASVLLGSAVMFPRLLFIVALVEPVLLRRLLAPTAVMVAVAVGLSIPLLAASPGHPRAPEPALRNPFALGPAIQFGLIFAGVSVATQLSAAWYGSAGVYATALFSGVADVDAITLSAARLVRAGTDAEVAARAVILGALMNTLGKGALAWAFGTRSLARHLAMRLLLVVASGGAVLALT